MTIGERIKTRRKELGLTVAEVADRLNKNRATVYRYESDEIENLPLTVLEPLSKVLKTTPAELIGYGENEDGDEISLDEAKKLFTDIFIKEGIIKPGQDLSDEQYKKAMQVLRALFDETGQ